MISSCRASAAAPVTAAAIVLCALCLPASAQLLPFRASSVKNGLVSNYITAFAQDRNGAVWIGTSDGVSISDGVTWRSYTTADGLPNNYVSAIVEDTADGRRDMIIATSSGLGRVRGRRIDTIRVGGSPGSNMVTDAAVGRNGVIWLGTWDGLYRLYRGRAERIRLQGVPTWISSLTCTPDGRVYMINDGGLFSFDPASRTARHIDSTSGRYVGANTVTAMADGAVFVCARDSSVLEYRAGRIVRHPLPAGQPLAIIRDNHGSYWIGTGSGLFFSRSTTFTTNALVRFGVENGLHADALNTGFIDREYTIWFGSEGKGVVRLDDAHILVFSNISLTGKAACDSTGRFWASSEQGLYEFWEEQDGGWRSHLHPIRRSWPGIYPYHMVVDRLNRLWVSFTPGHILRFDISRRAPGGETVLGDGTRVLPARGLPPPNTFAFTVDRYLRIWYAPADTAGLVVAETQPSVRAVRSFPNAEYVPYMWTIMEDRLGTVWIGGDGGRVLAVTMDDKGNSGLVALGPRDGLPDSRIRAIHRDRQHLIWIGTVSKGFGLIENGKVTPFTTREGLIADRVWSFAESPSGVIWIGTQVGLAMARSGTPSWFEYNRDLTDSPVYSCGVRKDGLLWAVTRYGLTLYDHPRSTRSSSAPPVMVTRVNVNGTDRAFLTPLSLSSSEDNLRIEFTSITHRRPEDIRYQYMLEGVDSTWRDAGGDRSVSLAALRPGRYEFVVRAVRPGGVVSREPARVVFTIDRPFWMQWWFISAGIMLLALGIGIPVRQRVRRLVEIERIRSRIASDLHDDIGSGLTRIALMTDVLSRQLRQTSTERDIHVTHPPPGTGSFDDVRAGVQRIGAISRELVEGMSDVVWSIDPRNDEGVKLMQRVKLFAVELCEAADIRLNADIDDAVDRLRIASDLSRCVLLVAKEALTNIARHSGASEVRLHALITAGTFILHIHDNGRGFERAALGRINGLENMRKRAEKAHGSIDIESMPGNGTALTLRIPIRSI